MTTDQCYPAVVIGGTIWHWHRISAPLCNVRCYVSTETPPKVRPCT
jgi:hypothetical protein